MFGRGSPRINLMQSASIQKKKGTSTMVGSSQQKGTSPQVHRARAYWNAGLERALVDLLHEHNSPCYRSQNGWTSEAWNRIVKQFREKFTYVTFSRTQIQEKEKELKRDYRTLKEARKQSGASWNERLGMIEAEPAVWDNIIQSHPKAKKFVTKPFPLFESLGDLYDGQTAEGTYNFTSLNSTQSQPDLTQVMSHDVTQSIDGEARDVEDDTSVQMYQDDDDDEVTIMPHPEKKSLVPPSEDRRPTTALRSKRATPAATARSEGDRVGKKSRQNASVVNMMEKFLDMKAKQVEQEAAEAARARENESAGDFSIKRCIEVLNTMDELTSEEKADCYEVFKDAQDREIFLTAEPVTRLIWLRKKLRCL